MTVSFLARRILPLALAIPFATSLGAPSFTITTVGGYDNSYANGINSNGDIVGSVQAINGISPTAPILFSGGVVTELSPASGFDDAKAINDSGTIVGEIGFDASVYAGAGIWNPLSSGLSDEVTAINNSGAASGNYFLDDLSVRHALRYSSGTATDLGTLVGNDGYSLGESINSAGDVVGSSDAASGSYHAVRFNNGGGILDLGTLDGDPNNISEAFDINDLGQIVGESGDANGDTRAFLWNAGTMIDLGTVPGYDYSEAYGINNLGQVVGRIADYDGATESAFFYDGTTMWDLATLIRGGLAAVGVSDFFDALDINDAGQIVGNGFTLDGNRVAYVLTPNAVPEPNTWGALTVLSLVAMIILRRRPC